MCYLGGNTALGGLKLRQRPMMSPATTITTAAAAQCSHQVEGVSALTSAAGTALVVPQGWETPHVGQAEAGIEHARHDAVVGVGALHSVAAGSERRRSRVRK